MEMTETRNKSPKLTQNKRQREKQQQNVNELPLAE